MFFYKGISLITILILLYCSGCAYEDVTRQPASLKNKIIIGTIIPTDIAENFKNTLYGGVLAAEHINQAGGIYGHEIGIINKKPSLGTDIDDSRALSQAKELFKDKKAVIIVTATNSNVSTIIEEANTNPAYRDMIMCSPSATSPLLTDLDINDNFYRTVANDIFKMKLMRKVIVDKGWGRISIFHMDDEFGTALKDNLELELTQAGRTLSDVYSYARSNFSIMDYSISNDLDIFITSSNLLTMDALALIILPQHIKDIANFLTNKGAGTATGNTLRGGLVLMDGGKEDIFPTATNFKSWADDPNNNVIGTETNGFAGINSSYFTEKFEKRFGEPHTFSPSMYDCVFMAGMALLYSGEKPNAKDYTPADMKTNIKNFKFGQCSGEEKRFGIGPDEFKSAADHIQNGGCVVYDGASGAVQFDQNGDRNEQDMNTYSVNKSGTGWRIVDTFRSDEL
jgi:branched-chain amino acid transport system substrate-binding protein